MTGAVTLTTVAVAVMLGAPAWAGQPEATGQRADPTPGPSANGIPISVDLTTQPVPTGPTTLPTTGTDIAKLVAAGLALVTAGGVIIIAGRRPGSFRRPRRRIRRVTRLSQG
jgi:LPXTG-motif cell wall-anchored protein